MPTVRKKQIDSESPSLGLVVFAFPLGVGALEVFDSIVFEVPESFACFVDQGPGAGLLTNGSGRRSEGRGAGLNRLRKKAEFERGARKASLRG
jgi:hypothetical protein